MREAVIILPRVNAFATKYMRHTLLDTFGGYTEHKATGAWRDPADGRVYKDHNGVFTVGVDDVTGEHMPALRNIAMQAGEMAGQISVYLKGFDGNVEFVNCSPRATFDPGLPPAIMDRVLAIETVERMEDGKVA